MKSPVLIEILEVQLRRGNHKYPQLQRIKQSKISDNSVRRPSNPQDVSGPALKGKVSWQSGAKKNYKVTPHNKGIGWENP